MNDRYVLHVKTYLAKNQVNIISMSRSDCLVLLAHTKSKEIINGYSHIVESGSEFSMKSLMDPATGWTMNLLCND